LNFSRLAVPPT